MAHGSERPAPRRQREDPDAVPDCRHFGRCGGCSLLDQPIRWQLHDKLEACGRLLAPFLGDVRIEAAAPQRAPRHFRTRLLYPVRADRDGLPIVGIYAFRSHDLVRIEECRTQDTWLTAFGRAAERTLRELELVPTDAKRGRGRGKGGIRAIWARLAGGSGEVLAGVVTNPGPFAEGPALASAWLEAAATLPRNGPARRLVGVVHSIRDGDDEFLLGDRHVPLRGADHVVDRRAGLTFRVSAGSFYQIHVDADALLYQPTLQLCGDVAGRRVVDGYGGVGTFGLRLARAGAAAVTIVEEGDAACRDAEWNAQANGTTQVRVVKAPFAGAQLPPDTDLLLVDPPRAGLGAKAVARVLAARPPRIVYVSCAPTTLADDLKGLVGGGYRLTAARLCDLFPHTEHNEVVVRLEREAPR
ncbi:MAG: class I SAM-dependent RNA methyltransferase [Planctomycetes bacterium]|nr:class I SAM-dependent RNA methyltransferase [Planctomycetota bacterium]